MKEHKPILAGGLYLGDDGHWQSATLVSDGHTLREIGEAVVSTAPLVPECQLLGLNAGQGIEQPLAATDLANAHAIPVITDLRQSDLAFGGRGGPLSPFYLHALARYAGESAPLVFLDLGSIAKVTWVDPTVAAPDDPAALLAFEAGPALSVLTRASGSARNADGQIGKVEDGALELFLQEPYFRRIAPKWLGGDSFENMLSLVFELSEADAKATLCGMIATSIMLASEHYPKPPAKYIVSGLGSQNNYLMKIIKSGLDVPVVGANDWGLDEKSFHAHATAFLAIRAFYGLATTAPSTTGVRAAIGGAVLSHPGGR